MSTVPDNLKAAVTRSDRNEPVSTVSRETLRGERKLVTVGKNSYVSLFKHHYSVPKEYAGRRMTILYDADTVEIYCGMNLVATHDLCVIPYAYFWKKEHSLPGHYGSYDKDLEELSRCASEIDNIVLNYLREVERFTIKFQLRKLK